MSHVSDDEAPDPDTSDLLGVLEEDPRAVEPTAISDIRISETWMDGRRVFQG